MREVFGLFVELVAIAVVVPTVLCFFAVVVATYIIGG